MNGGWIWCTAFALVMACGIHSDEEDFCVNQVIMLPFKRTNADDAYGARCSSFATVTTETLPSGVLVRCTCVRKKAVK